MTYRLIYRSEAKEGISDSEWRSIAMFSAIKNKSLGIAGLLLSHEKHVMQVLEGEEDAVKTLFDRISADPRHKNVDCIYAQTVTKPAFESWSMGYRPVESMAEMDVFFALSKNKIDDIVANTNQTDVQDTIKSYSQEAGLGE